MGGRGERGLPEEAVLPVPRQGAEALRRMSLRGGELRAVGPATEAPAAPAKEKSTAFDMFSDEVPAQPVADAALPAAEESMMVEYSVPVDNDDDEDGWVDGGLG